MDDVIGQGREPEGDARPPLPRRWRLAARALVVAAGALGLAFVGLTHLHQASGTPGGPAASTAAPDDAAGEAPFPVAPAASLPAPQVHPAYVICAPSTGVCSIRLQRSGIAYRAER